MVGTQRAWHTPRCFVDETVQGFSEQPENTRDEVGKKRCEHSPNVRDLWRRRRQAWPRLSDRALGPLGIGRSTCRRSEGRSGKSSARGETFTELSRNAHEAMKQYSSVFCVGVGFLSFVAACGGGKTGANSDSPRLTAQCLATCTSFATSISALRFDPSSCTQFTYPDDG